MSTQTLPENLHRYVQGRFRAQADNAYEKYPQYKGHFDTWVLGRVVQSERFKSGTRLERGMLTLMHPGVDEHDHYGAVRTTFDWQTGHIVGMPAHKIVEA